MPFTIQTTEQNIELELTGGVTARDVGELAGRLASSLTAAANVVVLTGKLDDIDTSVLQMLVSLYKTVNSLMIEDPSDAFVRAVDRCSLRRELLAGSKEVV
jgi:anti-anti-sigma regulatory factor